VEIVLVLLDLDGTLTDPYDGITRCVSYALEGLGRPRLGQRELRSFIGPPLQDRFASLGLDDSEVERAVDLYRERFRDIGLFENRVYDGIPEALAALAAVPVRLALATSKPTLFARRIVEHFGLDVHLDLVAGATLDGSRRTKADVIRFALTTLAVDPATAVMVGDREQDIVGARTMGLSSIGVTWGYAEPDELGTAGPDQLADTPQELVDALVDRHSRLTVHT
jgi:phosphoglycolate phosphatase